MRRSYTQNKKSVRIQIVETGQGWLGTQIFDTDRCTQIQYPNTMDDLKKKRRRITKKGKLDFPKVGLNPNPDEPTFCSIIKVVM